MVIYPLLGLVVMVSQMRLMIEDTQVIKGIKGNTLFYSH
jgi:hypothetical protein